MGKENCERANQLSKRPCTFYRFLQRMTEINMPADVGDFRLIDRKVANALKISEKTVT